MKKLIWDPMNIKFYNGLSLIGNPIERSYKIVLFYCVKYPEIQRIIVLYQDDTNDYQLRFSRPDFRLFGFGQEDRTLHRTK